MNLGISVRSETMNFDLIVIGAGPGGLLAAIECAAAGLKVMVLEKNEQPGKKLLATGGGQCNLTHDMPLDLFSENYHEKSRYVRKVLYHFPPETLRTYFEALGVELEVTPQGKVFPRSKKASDVLEALMKRLKSNHGLITNKAAVDRILRIKDGYSVTAAMQTHTSRAVLISTGGKSYPSLGTSGDGYALAQSLGHTIEPIRPSLAPVKSVETSFSDLAGVSIPDAWISLWRKNRKVKDYQGDLLFTHEGLSGPVILNNSRDFMPKDIIKLNFVRFTDEEAFTKGLVAHLNAYGKYTIRKALDYYDIPRRVMDRILEISGIPLDIKSAELNRPHRNALVKALVGYPVTLKEVGGFEDAMATAGGIATGEVNPGTMESRINPGLFFAGEVMDVDGVTGGFNLQFAFSSGYTAAQGIIKELKG